MVSRWMGLVLAVASTAASPSAARGPSSDDARSRAFRTVLREARARPADFAGHYVMVEVGCGAECVMLAALDRRNGRASWFPSTLCCWPASVAGPATWSLSGREVETVGMLDEAGAVARRRYRFDGRRFVPRGRASLRAARTGALDAGRRVRGRLGVCGHEDGGVLDRRGRRPARRRRARVPAPLGRNHREVREALGIQDRERAPVQPDQLGCAQVA